MDKLTNSFKDFVENNKTENLYKCLLFFPVIMSALLITTFIFPKIHCFQLLVIQIILMFGGVFVFCLFSSEMEEGDQKKFFIVTKITLLILMLYTVALPWRKFGSYAEREALKSIAIPFAVLTIIAWIGLITSEKSTKVFEYIQNASFSKSTEVTQKGTGDVVLCENFLKRIAKKKDAREIIPFKDRFLHMLILGATGTGKTSQILIPMIHQDIQNLECGVIVLEPKGDLAQKIGMMAEVYGREFKYFDPAMSNCPFFNPLAGREIDVVENMATTFRMLNPDSPTFFLDLSEQLVRNSVKVLKRLDGDEDTPGKYSTLTNLSRLVQNTNNKGLEMVNKFRGVKFRTDAEGKENLDIVSWFTNDYFAEKSKTYENTSGVRSQLAKICSNEFLREVLNPDFEKGEQNDVDFDKALADGEVLCLSTAQGVLRDLSRFLGYFVILQLQSAVFRRPGSEDTRRANFLYIDEFQVYSTPGFADMLTMGRSYRVASHLATQARAQMAMGGGKDGDNFVTLVSTNARNVVLFPGCSYDDAKYYSDQFGEKEEIEVQVGITRKKYNFITGGLDKLGHPSESIKETKKIVPVFTPTDLIYREFGDIVYCIIKKNSIQIPQIGKVSYIPNELNKKLDEMVAEYIAKYTRKTGEEAAEAAKQKEVNDLEILNDSDINSDAFEDDDENDDTPINDDLTSNGDIEFEFEFD